MTDLPDLKIKALVSFPTTVLDGTGIDVVKQNGSYQFNLAYDDFAPPVSGILDAAHQNILVWNSISQQYTLTPVSLFGAGGGIPDAPNDGVQYGRQSAAWTAIAGGGGGGTPSNTNPVMDGVAAPGVATTYSRGDHVHPTDTTRAPLASPTFTGDPKAPTPTVGDNDTSIATTAFVTTAVGLPVKAIRVQTFTASGTYTPNANMLYCVIECVGGGGGGGAAVTSGSTVFSGGGGASGSFSRLLASKAAIGVSKSVTIGAAGTGGPSGSNSGISGGQTSVGTLCIANGGGGGGYGAVSSVGVGGNPGVAGTGDIADPGAPGGGGFYNNTNNTITGTSGIGGSSIFGSGAPGNSGSAGATAPGHGGGGAGGYGSNAGGGGSAGIVIVTEFCSS